MSEEWLSKILDSDYMVFLSDKYNEEFRIKFIYREPRGNISSTRTTESILIGLTINDTRQFICNGFTEEHVEFIRQDNLGQFKSPSSVYTERIRLYYNIYSGVYGHIELMIGEQDWTIIGKLVPEL